MLPRRMTQKRKGDKETMRRFTSLCAIALLVVLASGALQADVVQRTYEFTGADLINNVFGSFRYSTDGSLWAYEGMRNIYSTPAGGTPAGATYLGATSSYTTTFHNLWNTAVANNRALTTFWLSGSNGYAGQWGEDYKPLEWVSGTGPTGWAFVTETDTAPKAGYLTDQYPVWTTDTAGLDLDAADLASQVFTVTVKFDTDDMWWGNPNNYLYGCNTAPNSLEGLTMYFGSYISEGETDVNRYVGNMFAAAQPIPEPVFFQFGALMGLSGFGVLKLRRR